MKYRRSEVRSEAHALPQLRFEDQALTSFAGLVIFQKFFASIDLKCQLRRCFEPLGRAKVFHPATVFLQLIVRITLDFDGSVLSTQRRAEGTAVGFNQKKKGARSYYPLFCTVAQTGQVLDVLHRPGNVHDSQGARAFILACIC
jgi:hypothetical protein